jgi:hypothetical protein
MFKLADSLGSSRGLYCGVEGLYLGPSSPLVERRNGVYEPRPEHEVAALLAAAYDPAPDVASAVPRLCAVAANLQVGDLGRAMMIAAVLLRIRRALGWRDRAPRRGRGAAQSQLQPGPAS